MYPLGSKEAGSLGVVHDNRSAVLADQSGICGVNEQEGGYAADVELLAQFGLP